MENRKVLLCPAGCGACPEVEFADEEVRVGEAGNVGPDQGPVERARRSGSIGRTDEGVKGVAGPVARGAGRPARGTRQWRVACRPHLLLSVRRRNCQLAESWSRCPEKRLARVSPHESGAVLGTRDANLHRTAIGHRTLPRTRSRAATVFNRGSISRRGTMPDGGGTRFLRMTSGTVGGQE